MGIADKKYSNVDKKTAEILVEAKLLLEEKDTKFLKPRKKSIARELMNVAYGNAFKTMSKDPDLTVRKICLKAIEDKFFDTCLDTLIKGPKKELHSITKVQKHGPRKQLHEILKQKVILKDSNL